MKITIPTKPNPKSYPAHRCAWGFRNPKNHLKENEFKILIRNMLASEDNQHIICPGCGRSIYLSMKIEGHNKEMKSSVTV